MNTDANDLLSTNVFVKTPDLNPNVSINNVDEFKRYYEEELKKKDDRKINAKLNEISLLNTNNNSGNDENNIYQNPTLISSQAINDNKNIIRKLKHIETLVSVDSRDRDKLLYPNANSFSIFLNKTFRNVKEIELVSIEFPNTDAVINSGNNMIYWRNQEDIDLDITVVTNGKTEYPVYSAEIVVGSYTLTTLENEIFVVTNLVKRKQGYQNGIQPYNASDYHFFVISLNINTDLVKFDSLIMQNLPNNSLATTAATGIISVSATNHGYSNNETIYINGANQIAGIDASVINGFHVITVINTNTFIFSVNLLASVTTTGGGNTMQSGKYAPFQFLWGVESNTIAQNLGFPLENSSELITTNILNVQTVYQMYIILDESTNFLQTYDYIGQSVSIGYIDIISGVSIFVSYGSYEITNIISNTEILVEVSDNTVYHTLLNNSSIANVLQFNNKRYSISGYAEYLTPSILITTSTIHNYLISDLGNTITLSNTSTFINGSSTNTYNIDGNYIINQLPTPSSIIVPGVLTYNINGGYMARQNPLTTWIVTIENVIPNYLYSNGVYYTYIETRIPHLLKIGDNITINNVISLPKITSNYYTVISVPSSNAVLISLDIKSVEMSSILSGGAFIGTGLITVSFPNHGFNSIISVSDSISYDVNDGIFTITDSSGNVTTYNVSVVSTGTIISGTILSIEVQTLNPHNLSIGDIVRLTFNGSQPIMSNGLSLTGGGYIVLTIPTSDTFTIMDINVAFTDLSIIPTDLNGIMGLSNSFYLYGATNVGGINESILNYIKYSVRDIYDINTFTFMSTGFAVSLETGGGSNLYISSLLHGYSGSQSNTKNNVLNRSINLEGENYSFLTCPTLNTVLDTGNVKNVFARISLDQPPGYICYSFLSNPKIFDVITLDRLETLSFSIYNYNNTLYEFNDLDYSMTLKITESVDYTTLFNMSSRRGIIDTTNIRSN